MLFYLLIISTAVVVLLANLRRPGGYTSVPALVSVLYLAWVAPQYLVLVQRDDLYSGNVEMLGAMALACLLMLIAGWGLGRQRGSPLSQRRELPVKSMALPVVVLTIFSTYMDYLVWSQPVEVLSVSQWTGPITIYALFASLRTVALALSVLMFLTKRTPVTIALIAINAAVTLPVAFVMLRRTEMITVAVVVLCALWFVRRIKVPLPLLFASALAFGVIVFAISPLRSASSAIYEETGSRPWIFNEQVWQRANVDTSLVGSSIEQAPDMRNAGQLISAVNTTEGFALGAVTWDDMVHRWVPAQIMGASFKASLMTGTRGVMQRISGSGAYRYQKGTTTTGFGSAYYDFGLLGSLYFLAFGYLSARCYNAGIRGDPWAQVLYMTIAPLILISFTHGHIELIAQMPLVYAAIISLRSLSRMVGIQKRAAATGGGSSQIVPTSGSSRSSPQVHQRKGIL